MSFSVGSLFCSNCHHICICACWVWTLLQYSPTLTKGWWRFKGGMNPNQNRNTHTHCKPWQGRRSMHYTNAKFYENLQTHTHTHSLQWKSGTWTYLSVSGSLVRKVLTCVMERGWGLEQRFVWTDGWFPQSDVYATLMFNYSKRPPKPNVHRGKFNLDLYGSFIQQILTEG